MLTHGEIAGGEGYSEAPRFDCIMSHRRMQAPLKEKLLDSCPLPAYNKDMNAFAKLILGVCLTLSACASAPAQTPPDNSGPVKMLAASRLSGAPELVGAQILPDSSLLLLSSSAVIHLRPDGQKILSQTRFTDGALTLEKMKTGPQGSVYLLGDAPAALTVARKKGVGKFIARLAPNFQGFQSALFDPEATDFGVDSNGDVVVLSGKRLVRYGADGAKKWEAAWQPHGQDRPQAMTLSPQTGVAVVLGYGMTGTGHEPYKDPYAFAFDRTGHALWTLWNPDPAREAGAEHGGNGLMADTTGHAAAATEDGRLLLMLFADGGNTVCGRDPSDPDKPLAPAVQEGVFQPDPGYGFQGAGKTSVLFRVNAGTGQPEKETWLCAWKGWPARDHANSLILGSAAGDKQRRVFAIGDSAYACPVLRPWVATPPDGYKGGSFLAVFDPSLQMLQCGTFPGVDLKAVSAQGGCILIAGSASGPVAAPALHALPDQPTGADPAGWFAVFQIGGSQP